jgi:hypothetical protein
VLGGGKQECLYRILQQIDRRNRCDGTTTSDLLRRKVK